MENKLDYTTFDQLTDMQGIRACLDQIHNEVLGHGMIIAATLIAAASEAIADEVSKDAPMTSDYGIGHLH